MKKVRADKAATNQTIGQPITEHESYLLAEEASLGNSNQQQQLQNCLVETQKATNEHKDKAIIQKKTRKHRRPPAVEEELQMRRDVTEMWLRSKLTLEPELCTCTGSSLKAEE